jgi:hypothetical protein
LSFSGGVGALLAEETKNKKLATRPMAMAKRNVDAVLMEPSGL